MGKSRTTFNLRSLFVNIVPAYFLTLLESYSKTRGPFVCAPPPPPPPSFLLSLSPSLPLSHHLRLSLGSSSHKTTINLDPKSRLKSRCKQGRILPTRKCLQQKSSLRGCLYIVEHALENQLLLELTQISISSLAFYVSKPATEA